MLKGLAQAKILKKSVVLFWLLNIFSAAHSAVRLDIETKFLITNYRQPCQKYEIREFRLYI